MAGGVRISVDVRPLKRFQQSLDPQSPVMDRLFRRIAAVYSAFTRRRFVAYSRGGGGWPYLAPSTIKRRRRGKGKGAPAILRDTGLLFMALTIGDVNNYTKRTRAGIVYGFGDAKKGRPVVLREIVHRNKNGEELVFERKGRRIVGMKMGGAKAKSFRQIASYHQEGGGRLPRRIILAKPDEQTVDQFNGLVRRAVNEAAAAAGAPARGAKP